MNYKRIALVFAFIVGFLGYEVFKQAHAQTYVTASVASYHLDRSKTHNEQNWGLGFEHEVYKDTRLAAGFYRNSNYIDSTYVGVAWTPLTLGDFKFGGFGGIFTGYAIDMKPGILPVATYERGSWGANLTYAPTTGGKNTSGVFGLQLKYLLK